MTITITTKKEMANGIDLKNLLEQVVAQYAGNDGGAHSLPSDAKFGIDASGVRVNAKHPTAVTIVEISGPEYSVNLK